jgi:putative membrane protein
MARARTGPSPQFWNNAAEGLGSLRTWPHVWQAAFCVFARQNDVGIPAFSAVAPLMSIIVRDALLHFAHFICIFLLASFLAGEVFVLRKTLSADRVAQLQVIDRWYGILAGLVIVTGLMLVFFGAKGASFYAHNAIFWTKMTIFVAIALISIVPTVAFLRWNQRLAADGSIVLQDEEYRRLRALLWLQVGLLVLLPFCAVLMANGLSGW